MADRRGDAAERSRTIGIVTGVPITDAVAELKRVPADYHLLQVAHDLGVSFGEP